MVKTNTFFVLDFDRCLASEKLYDLFNEVIAEFVELDDLHLAQQKTETEGGSFDMFRWLRETRGLSDTTMARISAAYIQRADQLGNAMFLADGAEELLAYLIENTIPYMIMTYGGYDYQVLKIRAAGLETIPHQIVTSRQKAMYIAAWWNDNDHVFNIPGDIQSTSVVLIDDKAVAFTGLPAQARGYWVKAQASLKSQEGGVPLNVESVDNLYQVVQQLNNSSLT